MGIEVTLLPAPLLLSSEGGGTRGYKSQRKKSEKGKFPQLLLFGLETKTAFYKCSKNPNAGNNSFTITPTRKNKDISVVYKMVRSDLYYRFTRNYGCSFRLHQGKQVQFRSTEILRI